MPGIISAIVVFIKLVLAIINIMTERNKEVKAKKEAALKGVQNAIQSGDDSALTAAFAKFNQL